MTAQFKKQKYKGFTIIVREQKPNVSYPMTDKARDKLYKKLNADEIFGSHSYEILNKKGEVVYEDKYDMWDYGACFENAKYDIKTKWVVDYIK